MKIRKRTIIISLVVIILMGMGYSAYAGSKAPKQVSAVDIKRNNLQVIVSASGKIQSENTVELSFSGTGRISYLPVKEGDEVKRGQVLGYLDGTGVKEQENKAWADYRIQLEKLRDFEESNKDKPKDINYQIAKSQLEATRDGYAALVAQTLVSYRDKTLVSPIDGVVAKVSSQVGEIPSSEPVITIVDEKHLEFIAEVDEQDIGTISKGQSSEIFLDAYNGVTFVGFIEKIDTIAKTGTSGNTYYPVHISIQSSGQNLLIGMGGDADIKTAEKKDVLTVPLDVLIDEDATRSVFTIKDSKVSKKVITTGLESDLEAEIVTGLSEGDRVISGDTSKLSEGELVQIEEKKK